MKMQLSAEDQAHLDALVPNLDLIRDRVRGVVNHLSTGLWLWGDGGLGKSFTVLEELQALKANYVLHNSRLTGRGLYDMLERFPDTLHVIEDCETLLDDKRARGVLRSALWSQSKKRPPEREITWTAFRTNLRCVFTGGIIMVANKKPEDFPEINAIKTRISVLQFVASNDQIAALMRSVSLKGYRYGEDFLAPEECLEVCEFIVEKFKGLDRNLDMRLLINGFKDFIQWKTGLATTHWEDLIETRLKETTSVPFRRAEKLARDGQVALEISQMAVPYVEKIKQWEDRTGHKGERSYYRALGRLEKVSS